MDQGALLDQPGQLTFKGLMGPKEKLSDSGHASKRDGLSSAPSAAGHQLGVRINYRACLRSRLVICKMQEDHSIYRTGCWRLDEVRHVSIRKRF